MVLHRETLPYEIRKTACELFAGRTGFTQEEMKAFFTEEIRKVVPPPDLVYGEGFFAGLASVMERSEYSQKLLHAPSSKRAEALEYWLSFLPLWRQRELLLELCRKPNFPMSRGRPSSQRRNELTAMLTSFVIDPHVSSALQRLDSASIMKNWEKAMGRCESDPQGAITAARTLLESTCKHILDSCGCSYDEQKTDLPKLYSLLAQELEVVPNPQSEQVLEQIFGGCQSVVVGLGRLRNQLSDAHGKGKGSVVPSLYLAQLAVNLAGSVTMFFVQTWEADQRSLVSVTAES
jgi:Abortive infection C-terminus